MSDGKRLAIVGARAKFWISPDGTDESPRIRALVFRIVSDTPPDTVVVSGESPGRGVDEWAQQAAMAFGRTYAGHPPRIMPGMTTAKYAEACHLRNQKIVDDADEVIAIVAPGCRGTWDTVRRAKLSGKLREILRPLDAGELVRGAKT